MGADSRQGSLAIGRIAKNISWELTLEERHHGIRSHEQNPAVPMEKRRCLEFDLEYEIGRDVLRIFSRYDILENHGRTVAEKLEGTTVLTSWKRNW